MRSWLMVLFLLPGATAMSWTDGLNDHEVRLTVPFDGYTGVDGTPWLPAEGLASHVDATGFSLEEFETELHFHVDVAETRSDSSGQDDFHEVAYRLSFRWHDEPWALAIVDERDCGQTNAELQTPRFSNFARQEVWTAVATGRIEPSANGWTASFAKAEVLDRNLVPLRVGDALMDLNFTADTDGRVSWDCPPSRQMNGMTHARDFGPQADLGTFLIERGPEGIGHLLLEATTPWRGSNGLATTYLFELRLRNLADQSDVVTFHLEDVPSDWTVHVPDVMELGARADETVPVAVSVPFKHVHGERQAIRVVATSQQHPDIHDAAEVGVIWYAIPQPGGHHPRLHLHANEDGVGWMNTETEDSEGTAQSMSLNFFRETHTSDTTRVDGSFRVPLSPNLRHGLDFDLRKDATGGGGRIVFDEAVTAKLHSDLFLQQGGFDEGLILGIGETYTIDFAAGEPQEIPFDLLLYPEADRIPFQAGMNLWMRTFITYEVARPIAIQYQMPPLPRFLVDEATIRLPLVDFHDIIDDDVMSSLTRLLLVAEGPTSREANAGNTAAFPFSLRNDGAEDDSISWRIEGEHAEWARIAPARAVVLAEDEVPVMVAIDVPWGAAPGDAADILIIGTSHLDGAKVFARANVQVTADDMIPDEAELAGELEAAVDEAQNARTPLPFIAAVSALLIALAHRRFER